MAAAAEASNAQAATLAAAAQSLSWSKKIGDSHVTTFLSRQDAYPTMSMTDFFEIDTKYSLPGFKRPDGSYNWHCGCVAKYVTGPCGIYFRRFMSNIDSLLKDESGFDDLATRQKFEATHSAVMRCAKKHEAYYKSFIEDIESGSAPSFGDVK